MAVGSSSVATPARVTARPTMGPWRALLAMARPTHVALIVVIYLDGVLYAIWQGAATTLPVVLGLLSVVLAAAAVHLANEAADDDTDRLARRTAFSGGSGALVASGLAARVPLLASLALSAMVVLLSVAAVIAGALSAVAVMLLAAGLVGGLAYSLPPVAAMRRGWGEPLNAVLGGLALPLFGVAVVAGSVRATDVLAFSPFAMVVFASVLTTAWPDREADAATGKATMQVRVTTSRLRLIHGVATLGYVVASLAVIASGALPAAWTLLLVTPAMAVGLRWYTRRRSPLPNVAAMVGLAFIMLTTLTLAVAA